MIDNTKEYIAAAAVWYDDGNIYEFQEVYGVKSGFVLGGFRHPMIGVIIPHDNGYPNNPSELIQRNTKINYTIKEGFITSYGRFVDRLEGRKIAVECNQCDNKTTGEFLYSEDIFKYQINYPNYNEEM